MDLIQLTDLRVQRACCFLKEKLLYLSQLHSLKN